MCGIVGTINKNDDADKSIVEKMGTVLNKRGPDSNGFYFDKKIGLGHYRLSIIDLSDRANQPMKNKDASLLITYNGEIYNYKELQKELSVHYSFYSNSDTEVLLKGYEKWGMGELLKKIDGMFAFVLIDKNKNKAFACRDIFGKKPLYYSLNENQFVFSSDIRSFKYCNINLSINKNCIDYYLSELSSPQPNTIYNEVMQVSPSTCLELDLKNFESDSTKYWDVNSFHQNKELTLGKVIDKTEELLSKSIQKRLVGDVPVCTFLSGGADSGLITALYAQLSDKKIDTFTAGFNYEEYNELPFAKQLSKKYNTNHHELILEADILNDFDFILDHLGEPFADSSAILSYYVSKEMHKHCKVALSGDGGDEIFGGNYEYQWAYNTDCFYKKYPHPLTRKIIQSINQLIAKFELTDKNFGLYDYYYKLLPELKMFRQMGFNPLDEKNNLYASGFNSNQNKFTQNFLSDAWASAKGQTLTEKVFKSFINTRLLNDYLVKVDRTSMMNSLEIRCPFLDKQLSEFAFSVPAEIKLKDGHPKYLLKQLAEKHIDKKFSQRKKMGFSVPMRHWINNELKTFVDNTLSETNVLRRGIFNFNFVLELLAEHRSGKKNNADKIWALVILEHWFKKNKD